MMMAHGSCMEGRKLVKQKQIIVVVNERLFKIKNRDALHAFEVILLIILSKK